MGALPTGFTIGKDGGDDEESGAEEFGDVVAHQAKWAFRNLTPS